MLGYQILWDEQFCCYGYGKNCLLVEERGVYDPILEIADELYHLISRSKPILVEKGQYLIKINNYPIQTANKFLEIIKNIKVYFGESIKPHQKSYFGYNDDTVNLSKNKKLINIGFTINLHNQENKVIYEDFKDVMIHELQHAYWYWNILTSPSINATEDEIARMQNYRCLKKTSSSDEEELVKTLFYVTERNEIEAFGVQLYNFILNNKDINQTNVFEKASKTDLGYNIIFLETIVKYIKNAPKETKYKLGQAYMKVFNRNDITPKKAILMLYQRVVKEYKYMVDKFYQIAGKALLTAINELHESGREVTILINIPQNHKTNMRLIREIFKKN